MTLLSVMYVKIALIPGNLLISGIRFQNPAFRVVRRKNSVVTHFGAEPEMLLPVKHSGTVPPSRREISCVKCYPFHSTTNNHGFIGPSGGDCGSQTT
jgi:hypothetical protein